ncbi:MAG: alpha/beta hydrolase [Myxococcales bacterium]|nr:alpha/beta hydrolase [Myxococcales bacterium]
MYRPNSTRIPTTLILAHGAGADQSHPFMVRFASGLAARGLATVTFNFLYTEARRRLPDRNDALEACWRAVISTVAAIGHGDRLAIGGKSMGGRIASQIAAQGDLDLAGLLLLGYPLHPPGKPEQLRTRHLAKITTPTLIIQGERDAFGTPDEIRPFLVGLPARLRVVTDGDHSLKIPKRAGSQEALHDTLLDEIAAWLHPNPAP